MKMDRSFQFLPHPQPQFHPYANAFPSASPATSFRYDQESLMNTIANRAPLSMFMPQAPSPSLAAIMNFNHVYENLLYGSNGQEQSFASLFGYPSKIGQLPPSPTTKSPSTPSFFIDSILGLNQTGRGMDLTIKTGNEFEGPRMSAVSPDSTINHCEDGNNRNSYGRQTRGEKNVHSSLLRTVDSGVQRGEKRSHTEGGKRWPEDLTTQITGKLIKSVKKAKIMNNGQVGPTNESLFLFGSEQGPHARRIQLLDNLSQLEERKKEEEETRCRLTEENNSPTCGHIPRSPSPLSISTPACSPGHNGSEGEDERPESKNVSTKSKRIRTIFTPEQLEKLELEFSQQQYMVGPPRLELAASLNLSEAQVKVWFQNRRIKKRKQDEEENKRMLASHQPAEATESTCHTDDQKPLFLTSFKPNLSFGSPSSSDRGFNTTSSSSPLPYFSSP